MVRFALPVIAIATVAMVIAAISERAGGAQLLTNPGFEDGTAGWTSIDAEIYPSNRARSGAGALEIYSPGFEANPDVYQWLPVQPAGTYEFSGWVIKDDPNADRVTLRISWFTDKDELVSSWDSDWLTGSASEYRFVTTATHVAPLNAATARVSVGVATVGPGSVWLDDFSLEGPDPEAVTPTASITPTVAPTPSPPTASPSPTSSSPTAPLTPSSTVTAAPTPGSSSSPATGTPITPTLTRTPTATPLAATPRPTPTPSSIPPSESPTEPAFFTTLTNGGFESVRSDGTGYGWRKIGGTMTTIGSPVLNGSRAMSLSSSGTSSTKWVYQTVSINGGWYYEGSVYAWKNDPKAETTFVRISWYSSADGSGEAISTADSTEVLTSDLATFRLLSTGAIQAPPEARSARLRLMLRPAGTDSATVVFDDAAFVEAVAPSPTPTPSPAPSSEPTRTTAQASGTASTAPTNVPTATRTATATPRPSPTPVPAATATPVPEPDFFSSLTNGGFEISREDQTPYGWHKVGGIMTVNDTHRMEGELSLELTSASTSSKWAYQAVAVQPSAYYSASAWTLVGAGSEAEMRVSWYSSEDGSGSALSTVESAPIEATNGGFRLIEAGVLEAPADARSARLRLFVRPDSSSPVSVFFDGVSMVSAESPGEGAAVAAAQSSDRSARPVLGARSSPAVEGDSADNSAETGESPATPPPLIEPVNVRPAADAQSEEQLATDVDEDGPADWVLGLLIVVPALGIVGVLGYDAAQRRRPDEE